MRFGGFALRLQAQSIIGPAADEPIHVLDDGIDILDLFLGRVGVVHAQVADAAELPGDAEVEANALGMADVQVAVGFGRETGMDLRIFFFSNMPDHDVANEIRGRAGPTGYGWRPGNSTLRCRHRRDKLAGPFCAVEWAERGRRYCFSDSGAVGRVCPQRAAARA